jgi:hypothetical protein
MRTRRFGTSTYSKLMGAEVCADASGERRRGEIDQASSEDGRAKKKRTTSGGPRRADGADRRA